SYMANMDFGGGSNELSQHMGGNNGNLSFYVYKPAEGINDPDPIASVDRVSKGDVLDRLDSVLWIKESKTELAETDILLSTGMLTQILQNKDYNIDYTAFDAAMLANAKIDDTRYDTNTTNRILSAQQAYDGTEDEFYAETAVQDALLAVYGIQRPANMTAEGARYLGERLTNSSINYDEALVVVGRMHIANFVIENNYHRGDSYEDAFVKSYLKNHNISNQEWVDMQSDAERLSRIVSDNTWEIRWSAQRFDTTRAWLYESALAAYVRLCGISQDDLAAIFDGYIYQLNEIKHGVSMDDSEKMSDLENVKIVGFFTQDSDNGDAVVSTMVYNKWEEWQAASYEEMNKDEYIPDYQEDRAEHESGVWAFVLAPISAGNNDAVHKLVELSYADPETTDILYEMQNAVMYTLGSFNEMIEILAQVFVWVGLGLAVFSSFLLMNFISTSISYKKREIGILRAVGARSSDVFKIFFSEAFIIAFINFLLATAASVATVIVLNNYMRSSGINITLLSFGPMQVAVMLGVSVLVAVLASFLPVYKIAHKKPVDAIKDR
ncbi:MAG: ABC transporter permease, partial [Clostridia bacterium]|nr:ABC transporter permease [Clostridia bacterium]